LFFWRRGNDVSKIAKRVGDRLTEGLKKYQPLVAGLRERDVSEADTVTVIKDMLCDVFGYDKYLDLTSEQQIRGTFCDLAIKLEGKVYYLAEVKSAGTTLNDSHLRQAVNYGANHGIEWIILTNAVEWRIYRLKFAQPIAYREVVNFDFLKLTPKRDDDLDRLFLLCKEGINVDALSAFHSKAQMVNRYTVAEFLRSDAVLATLRREMRRTFEGIRIEEAELSEIILNEILKRDVVESEAAVEARASLKKALQASARRIAKETRLIPVTTLE
jgi:predicted type IV restriction endonuclease